MASRKGASAILSPDGENRLLAREAWLAFIWAMADGNDSEFPLVFRTIEATLADVLDDDEEYQEAVAKIDKDPGDLERALERMGVPPDWSPNGKSDNDRALMEEALSIADREKHWRILREIKKAGRRAGIWSKPPKRRDTDAEEAMEVTSQL